MCTRPKQAFPKWHLVPSAITANSRCDQLLANDLPGHMQCRPLLKEVGCISDQRLFTAIGRPMRDSNISFFW